MNVCSYNVFRNTRWEKEGYDPTAGGLTSLYDEVVLFFNCSLEEAIDYATEKGMNLNNCLYLVERSLWGEDHSYAEPLIKPEDRKLQMFGGNFIYTSNGMGYHFKHYPSTTAPIPVHDRFEIKYDE